MNHKWNIFFSESVGGGRKYKELYERIVEQLQDYGVLLSQFGGDPDEDECKYYLFQRGCCLKHAYVAKEQLTRSDYTHWHN